MDDTRFNTPGEQRKIDSVAADILRNVRINRSFILWMGFLATLLALCLFAYVIQLRQGLGVTGLRDYTSWGMYIANFVFFVATSLVGMGCHSLDGSKLVGPSFAGLYGSQRSVTEGNTEKTEIADEAYIVSSIYDPNKEIVVGYARNLMQSYRDILTVENIAIMTEYLKTLRITRL
jgi:hypothetical protein